MKKYNILILICCSLIVVGCSANPTSPDLSDTLPNIVTAQNLAGTYTGVLEGITIADINTLEDTSTHTIVDIDLLHTTTLTDLGGLMLRIESAIIPKTRAIVFGMDNVAINLEFIEFENLFTYPQNDEIFSLKVKNIAFVKYEGEWIFVLQISRVGFAGDNDLDGVYVYQYVSYPSTVAQQMSEDDAIQYVNTILNLASAAQR